MRRSRPVGQKLFLETRFGPLAQGSSGVTLQEKPQGLSEAGGTRQGFIWGEVRDSWVAAFGAPDLTLITFFGIILVCDSKDDHECCIYFLALI